MKMIKIAIFPAISILFAGCFAEIMKYRMDRLSPRVAFDFECPKEQLQFHQLDPYGTTLGVSGCGKRATYVLIEDQWYQDTPGSNTIPIALEVERMKREEEKRRQEEEERRKKEEEEERQRREENN